MNDTCPKVGPFCLLIHFQRLRAQRPVFDEDELIGCLLLLVIRFRFFDAKITRALRKFRKTGGDIGSA
jgi:hypothetical protein